MFEFEDPFDNHLPHDPFHQPGMDPFHDPHQQWHETHLTPGGHFGHDPLQPSEDMQKLWEEHHGYQNAHEAAEHIWGDEGRPTHDVEATYEPFTPPHHEAGQHHEPVHPPHEKALPHPESASGQAHVPEPHVKPHAGTRTAEKLKEAFEAAEHMAHDHAERGETMRPSKIDEILGKAKQKFQNLHPAGKVAVVGGTLIVGAAIATALFKRKPSTIQLEQQGQSLDNSAGRDLA